jgi:uncharacterized protein (DUF2249 family)
MIEPLTIDVREELRAGGEPLARILQAVKTLEPGQALRLLATFEPLPLYAVLRRKGFDHAATRRSEGDWEVLFEPQQARTSESPVERPGSTVTSVFDWPKPSVHLDNRGLLPPEPMMRILDALEHLGAGDVLEALNEREPVFLFPELQARGAAIHTEKTAQGVRILIRRGGETP